MKPVELFHLGPQKTATTWFYKNLKTHPQVVTSPGDSIHYFDIHYYKGREWYENQFEKPSGNDQKYFDPTPGYIACELAPARIHAENPQARMIFVLRNPVDRAFSHYWHFKKKGGLDYPFSDALRYNEFYAMWLGPSLLGKRLEDMLALFKRDQLLPVIYEDIAARPAELYGDILEFYELDKTHHSPYLTEKVNVAGNRRNIPQRAIGKLGRTLNIENAPLISTLSGKAEYLKGIEPGLYNEFLSLCLSDIEKIESLLDINLSHWKQEKKAA